jgi:hypothetical protein
MSSAITSFPLASAALTATDATITHRVRLDYVLLGTPIAWLTHLFPLRLCVRQLFPIVLAN